MPESNIIVGLDIGTTKVAVCVAQVSEGLLNILSLTKAPNNGLRKGMVIDIEECVSSISGVLESAERMAGVQLDHAIVGVGGAHIMAVKSKGIVAVSRADGEISQADIERAIEAARVIALPPNREILTIVPHQYIVDGQDEIKDPLGMNGIRLEVETLVVGGATSAIKNLTKCVYQAGVQIHSLVYSPLACAKALLSRKQRENGVALIDIGAGTTSLAVFEENDLIHTAILPLGSMHITNDIAIGLRISLEAAEKVKLQHGFAYKAGVKDTEKIDLSKIDPSESERVERKMAAEIIEERLKEIFGMIKDEIKSIGKDGMLPAGAVLTGGGTLLEGLADLAKEELHLPAQLSKPNVEMTGMVDKLDHPVYATSIGLMLCGFENSKEHPSKPSKIVLPVSLSQGMDKIKQLLKQFLP